MKKLFLLLLLFSLWGMTVSAQNDGSEMGETNGKLLDEKYRRSSLCLVFLTHQNTQYAKEMEKEMMAMPMPDRYNDHNVTCRVISVAGEQDKKSIMRLLENQDIARRLVSKWFNRDESTGAMNMDLIHERGGYSASYEDLQRANMTERGTALLTDEGVELLQNTFVLVCDMSYYDKQETGQVWSAVFSALGETAKSVGNEMAKQGDYEAAAYTQIGAVGAVAGSAAVSQMAGFAVNMNAHLFQLKWDNSLTAKMFNEYWIDDETPENARRFRKNAYENDYSSFKLEYLGNYLERSSKTTFDGGINQNEIIGLVCKQTLEKGMVELARQFPVFKIKAPVYRDEQGTYAYIGTKEGMTNKTTYDVLEATRTDNGIKYNKVGRVKPQRIWNNTGFNMSTDAIPEGERGSTFNILAGNNRIGEPGLLLNEHGSAKYKYKRWFFNVGLFMGAVNGSKGKAIEEMDRKNERLHANLPIKFNSDSKYLKCFNKIDYTIYGFNVGTTYNYNTNIAWNVVDGDIGLGDNDCYHIGVKTGLILRTNPLGKNGALSFFVWPCVGYRVFGYRTEYTIEKNSYDKIKNVYDHYERDKFIEVGDNGLDYELKVGVNVTRKFYIAGKFCDYFKGVTLGLNL